MIRNYRRLIHNSNDRGMTLIEIMIVLAILAGLIAILSTTVMSRFKKAKVKQAKIQMSEIGKQLDMFYTDCGFYPKTEQGLKALVERPKNCADSWGPDPYLEEVPTDPWGNSYKYEATGGSYVITSLGADRRPGGEGDNADISSDEL